MSHGRWHDDNLNSVNLDGSLRFNPQRDVGRAQKASKLFESPSVPTQKLVGHTVPYGTLQPGAETRTHSSRGQRTVKEALSHCAGLNETGGTPIMWSEGTVQSRAARVKEQGQQAVMQQVQPHFNTERPLVHRSDFFIVVRSKGNLRDQQKTTGDCCGASRARSNVNPINWGSLPEYVPRLYHHSDQSAKDPTNIMNSLILSDHQTWRDTRKVKTDIGALPRSDPYHSTVAEYLQNSQSHAHTDPTFFHFGRPGAGAPLLNPTTHQIDAHRVNLKRWQKLGDDGVSDGGSPFSIPRQLANPRHHTTDIFDNAPHYDPDTAAAYHADLDRLVQHRRNQATRRKEEDTLLGMKHVAAAMARPVNEYGLPPVGYHHRSDNSHVIFAKPTLHGVKSMTQICEQRRRADQSL
ncbi:hypothetical protein DFJ77DRAFT_453211, partial [Powellomyces hirtus]